MKSAKEYHIHEPDIYDSMRMLVDLIEHDGVLPTSIIYNGVEQHVARYTVVGYVD